MKIILAGILLSSALVPGAYALTAPQNSTEIAAVESGRNHEAKASWWGFDSKDATECLQKAIDSGVKKLIVDNTGSPWQVKPIHLRSNQEIVFADGVVVRALPGAFKGQGESLFTAKDIANVILRGEGNAVLMMNKKDYQDTSRYVWSEWRHLLNLRGATDITISNLTLKSSGGDGIYVSMGSKLRGCRNILIENVVCDDHHRQGISVIGAENLLVRNSRFINTRGTPPQCGLDIEPNTYREFIINNVFENCEFSGNASAGVTLHLAALNTQSAPISVIFRNCRSIGNRSAGFNLYVSATTPVKGSILLENCMAENNRDSALILNNQQNAGLKITVKNTLLDNRSSSLPGILLNSSNVPSDLGGVRFEQLRLIPGKSTPVTFLGMTGRGIRDLSGTLLLEDADGKTKGFDLAKFTSSHRPDPKQSNFSAMPLELKKLRPRTPKADTKGKTNQSLFRGRIRFLQYCPAAGEYPITFKVRKVTKFPLKMEVRLRDAAGTDLGRFLIDREEKTWNLKANGPNLFTFEITTAGDALSIHSPFPGQAVRADDWVGMFGGRNHSFSILAPAGAKEINIDIAGTLREPVTAQLIAPDGKVVQEVKNLEGMKRLHHIREKFDTAEVWTLKIPYAREDFKFRIGAPLPPLVSFAPEFLLME